MKKIIVLITLTLIFIIGLSYQMYGISNPMPSNADVENTQLIKKQVLTEIQAYKEKIDVLITDVRLDPFLKADYLNEHPEYINELHENLQKTNPELQYIFMGTKESKMYMQRDLRLPTDYDPTIRPWYKNAMASQTPAWSDAYLDLNTGELLVTISTETSSGVVGMDISLSSFLQAIDGIETKDTSFLLIQNQELVYNSSNDNSSLSPEEFSFISSDDSEVILKDNTENYYYQKTNIKNLNLILLVKTKI